MEFFVIWLLCSVISAVIASNKGLNVFSWSILGFLLGPFGVILAIVVSKNEAAVEQSAIQSGTMKKCPYCAELIKNEATICRYCNKIYPKKIVVKKSLNIKNPDWFALKNASFFNYLEVLNSLIDKGFDIESKDDDGKTILIDASEKGQIDAVKTLLSKGANINAKDSNGKSSLIYASCESHIEIVKVLLDKGAYIDEIDNQGYTALIWASKHGEIEIAKILIDKNANLDIKSYYGDWTAMQCALHENHTEIIKMLRICNAKS